MVRGQPRHVAAYAKDFLFRDAQLRQPVASLSGGERNRLLLARALATPANLLVLDEPTNDLDMDTLDLLEDLLADYDGTLILVSHDRDFIDRLATSTIALDGRGGVVETPGGWSDFIDQNPGFLAAAARPRRRPAAAPAPRRAPRPAGQTLLQGRASAGGARGAACPAVPEEIAGWKRLLADPGLYARDAAAFARRHRRPRPGARRPGRRRGRLAGPRRAPRGPRPLTRRARSPLARRTCSISEKGVCSPAREGRTMTQHRLSRRALAAAIALPALCPRGACGAVVELGRASRLTPLEDQPYNPPTSLSTVADIYRRMTAPIAVNEAGPFAFVVDTGANQSVISRELADSLGLPKGPAEPLNGVAGLSQAPTTTADLRVGARPAGRRGALGSAGRSHRRRGHARPRSPRRTGIDLEFPRSPARHRRTPAGCFAIPTTSPSRPGGETASSPWSMPTWPASPWSPSWIPGPKTPSATWPCGPWR